MDSDDTDGNTIGLQLLVLAALTLVNAFFAGAEMAVVSVNKNRIRRMAEKGDRRAILLEQLSKDSTKFLSTIQVAITLAGFFSSASAATGISRLFGRWLDSFSVPYSEMFAVVTVTILLSYFTLVFGELVPKRIALQKAEAFSLLVVRLVFVISKLLSPFIRLLTLSTNGFLRLIGMKTEHLEEAVSEEEIKAMLEIGSEAGVFNEIEKEMITSIFSFDDKTARDVMIPRREVFAIDTGEPIEERIDELLESRYSRIPVYEGKIDNIVGVLHMKDFLIEMRKSAGFPDHLNTLMRRPYYVPDSKNADELFKEMQRTRNRMAILIDEYGGFSGIVTMEDLVEEIMGELSDEHETAAEEIQKVDDSTYLLDGGMLIEDLNAKLHLTLKTENYDTLSGFLIEQMDCIPENEQVDPVIVDHFVFTILEVCDKRIRKVQLKKAVAPFS